MYMSTKEFIPPLLPARKEDWETTSILKQLVKSHRALAEMKGTANIIPYKIILIETLMLREAKESSAIENIITTQDDIYKARLFDKYKNVNTKEVENYVQSLYLGFKIVKEKKMIISRSILELQKTLLKNDAGFRTQSGTVLKDSNGNTVYVPPQDKNIILDLMKNLEDFINNNDFSHVDPLIKMAVIHYQFESIHPFYDGNGRVGRIINILYLILQGLLDSPILYLSSYIIDNKSRYYDVLQNVRVYNNWEDMILYLLKSIEHTAEQTTQVIKKIHQQMLEYKDIIRTRLPKIYSQDLINTLFKHPYTKIEFLKKDLNIAYSTARRYLDKIVELQLLEKCKIGKSNYYLNNNFIEILRWKH